MDGNLIGTYHPFSAFHLHYEVWALNSRFHQAITATLRSLPDSERLLLDDFWESSIVEFHLYYLQPLLSATRCNRATIQKIVTLDRRSLTPNGLNLTGIRTETTIPKNLGEKIVHTTLQAGIAGARTVYGIWQLLRSLSVKPSTFPHEARLAFWIPSTVYLNTYLELLESKGHENTVFLSHEASVFDVIRKRVGTQSAFLIQDEGTTQAHPFYALRFLRTLKNELRELEHSCDEHAVCILPEALWQLWLNFFASRWPAYLAFHRSATAWGARLSDAGIKTFVVSQERNLRERVWCRRMRALGIRSLLVQVGLLGPDPYWCYRLELDQMLVDSEFTATQLALLGHSPERIQVLGYAGVRGIRSKMTAGERRQLKKLELGLPTDRPIVFFATQDVAELAAGSQKIGNTSISEIKTRELQHVVRMAKKHGFFVALKPHRAERTEFYRNLLNEGDPVRVFDKEDSPYTLLGLADVLISRWSTLSYEAMACGIPVYVLNFYHYLPKLAIFEELWVFQARTAETAEQKFDGFWKEALEPKYREKFLNWAESQGWNPEADERIRQALSSLT